VSLNLERTDGFVICRTNAVVLPMHGFKACRGTEAGAAALVEHRIADAYGNHAHNA
jgi:hypothetical protein